MSQTEQEADPIHIPVGIGQVHARLNERLAGRRQYLHRDSASGVYSLVDLAKARVLTPAQLDALARETETVSHNEVIVHAG